MGGKFLLRMKIPIKTDSCPVRKNTSKSLEWLKISTLWGGRGLYARRGRRGRGGGGGARRGRGRRPLWRGRGGQRGAGGPCAHEGPTWGRGGPGLPGLTRAPRHSPRLLTDGEFHEPKSWVGLGLPRSRLGKNAIGYSENSYFRFLVEKNRGMN